MITKSGLQGTDSNSPSPDKNPLRTAAFASPSSPRRMSVAANIAAPSGMESTPALASSDRRRKTVNRSDALFVIAVLNQIQMVGYGGGKLVTRHVLQLRIWRQLLSLSRRSQPQSVSSKVPVPVLIRAPGTKYVIC